MIIFFCKMMPLSTTENVFFIKYLGKHTTRSNNDNAGLKKSLKNTAHPLVLYRIGTNANMYSYLFKFVPRNNNNN